MKYIAFACLGFGLLVSGCGEQLTSEAQKAVEQIKVEASRVAVKTIDDIEAEAVTRLKKVQGTPDKNDKPQKKSVKNEDVMVQKLMFNQQGKESYLP
jgi:hypothetical protein